MVSKTSEPEMILTISFLALRIFINKLLRILWIKLSNKQIDKLQIILSKRGSIKRLSKQAVRRNERRNFGDVTKYNRSLWSEQNTLS